MKALKTLIEIEDLLKSTPIPYREGFKDGVICKTPKSLKKLCALYNSSGRKDYNEGFIDGQKIRSVLM